MRDLSQSTLVIQSHSEPLPIAWLQPCIESVRAWTVLNNYHYRFIGDEIFAAVPAPLLEKTRSQRVVATDLARLLSIRRALAEGYAAVVWCDVDFLVFQPAALALPASAYALGREVWVERSSVGQLRARVKVHNAFLLFRRGNSFLEFYIDTAIRLLEQIEGPLPPQFIGPKLLTALHNVAQCPVLETAAMFSPLLVLDVLQGGGEALELFQRRSRQAPVAANLCSSLAVKGEISDVQIEQLIALLLQAGQWPGATGAI